MYNKEQIIEKISEISRQRSKLDELYVTLQKTVSSYQSQTTVKSVTQMRDSFNVLISQLSLKIIQRNKELDTLKFRTQKLIKEGQIMTSQERNIQSLKDYFSDLKHNLSKEKQKGQKIITQKQIWQVKGDTEHLSEQDMSLLSSHKLARQANELADGMYLALKQQEGILVRSKNKMGQVLKNINLAANITRMVRNRSKEDNWLIFWLTIGLLVEIVLCLFLIKPMVRGD